MSTKEPFEQVVAEHGERVLRVCRVILGPHDAEDAWSETFIAALRAYPDLPADANVGAWLVTIAHRKAIDSVRATKRRPLPVDSIPEDPRPGDSIPDEPRASVRAGASAREDGLWRAVKALPDKQRQAIAYHFLGDLSFPEVSRILGGSPDAARRAAADGIKTLRSHYARIPAAQGET